ncbi:MAG: hypothetical protein EXQ94_08670 [Alphaproteobacteria bacterium]|nr:hypothetical protein [Alphaproteobacteria bacterium]
MSPPLRIDRPIKKPPGPRAIVVHDRDDAEAAAAEALAADVPVILLTAQGAAAFAGVDYLLGMIAQGAAPAPGAKVEAVLDCDEAAGDVLNAIRVGWKRILFTGDPELGAKLADIVGQAGGTLLTRRPEALDLEGERNPHAACRAWLKLGVR